MGERCKICVDPQCEGKENCCCSTCTKKEECHRTLRPTIRITKKCTQACSHCCFECSPEASDHMTMEVADNIAKFLEVHEITYANIMGGEVWSHLQWKSILSRLLAPLTDVRLPTNGDWAGDERKAGEVLGFLKEHPQIRVMLSEDPYHTNQHVEKALQLCEEHDVFAYKQEEFTERSIMPLGRSRFEWHGFYGTMGTYCTKPDRMYTFLIDEEGEIYKCCFGIWNYASVEEHLDGSFFARFKDFGRTFNGCFISSCKSCSRSWERVVREEREKASEGS